MGKKKAGKSKVAPVNTSADGHPLVEWDDNLSSEEVNPKTKELQLNKFWADTGDIWKEGENERWLPDGLRQKAKQWVRASVTLRKSDDTPVFIRETPLKCRSTTAPSDTTDQPQRACSFPFDFGMKSKADNNDGLEMKTT